MDFHACERWTWSTPLWWFGFYLLIFFFRFPSLFFLFFSFSIVNYFFSEGMGWGDGGGLVVRFVNSSHPLRIPRESVAFHWETRAGDSQPPTTEDKLCRILWALLSRRNMVMGTLFCHFQAITVGMRAQLRR